MTPKIVPFIFNWTDQFENACRTEEQLRVILDEVIVINSDEHHTRSGWVDIGEESYFTAQFFKALDLFDGDILFHMQADATFHDWPSLFENAVRHFREYNWGVYAPNVDFTGWSSEKVDIESNLFRQPALRLVSNTDCTCWFIHREIIEQFLEHGSLFSENRYGWGIDLTMAALSYLNRRPVIRDYGHTIVHPRGHGYDRDGASVEYRAYLAGVDDRIRPVLNLMLNDRQQLAQLVGGPDRATEATPG